jgi:RNA polymerase sigma-70 factor (ECF subfamily)
VTRLCIDRLRASRSEREAYLGPWLPEPLLDDAAPPADHSSELASDLSMAFLVVLERLAPVERAAFSSARSFRLRLPGNRPPANARMATAATR